MNGWRHGQAAPLSPRVVRSSARLCSATAAAVREFCGVCGSDFASYAVAKRGTCDWTFSLNSGLAALLPKQPSVRPNSSTRTPYPVLEFLTFCYMTGHNHLPPPQNHVSGSRNVCATPFPCPPGQPPSGPFLNRIFGQIAGLVLEFPVLTAQLVPDRFCPLVRVMVSFGPGR